MKKQYLPWTPKDYFWFIKLIFLSVFLVTIIKTGLAIAKYKVAIFPKQVEKTENITVTPIEGEVVGTVNGSLGILSLQSNKVREYPVGVGAGEKKDTIRISPDHTHVFVSNGMAAANPETAFKVTIISLSDNKIINLIPTIPPGFVYGKIATGTGFGDEYIGWEASGKGIVYQVHNAKNPLQIQYRFVSLENIDSLILTTTSEEETEEVLVGYKHELGNLYVASIKLPGSSLALYRLQASAKKRVLLQTFETGTLPIWRNLSPEGNYFLGIFSNQKTDGVVVNVDDMRKDTQVFPNAYDESNGLFGFFFVDNETAGQIAYSTAATNSFVITKVALKGFTASAFAKKVTISPDVQKVITNELFIDATKTGIILTTKHVTNGSQTKTLPDDFTPVAFVKE